MDTLSQSLQQFYETPVPVGLLQACLTLLTSFIFGAVIAKVYQHTYRGKAFSASFMHTLVISTMVIAAVMLIIGSSMARAFGLLGALSVIRFRNSVRDPRDVAFIFLAMGVGMACGTGNFKIALALTFMTSAVAYVLMLGGFGEDGLSERTLRVIAPFSNNFERLYDDILKKHTSAFQLLAAETVRLGTELELTFGLQVLPNFSAEKLIEDLTKAHAGLKLQLTHARNNEGN